MLRRLLPVLALGLLLGSSVALRRFEDRVLTTQPRAPRWYKGNTHTHTINSDGDSHPDDVVKWYRSHGYQFVVLTDHNVITSVEGLNALHGLDARFLVIRGEEVTDRFGGKPLHINALAPARLVQAQGGTSALDVVQRNVAAIREAEGVPHVNHPNFGWALSAEELAQVRGLRLFEIFNGHPQVNNEGGGGVPGLEAMWDQILSRGDFYSSTGVELNDYAVTDSTMTLTVRETAWSKYRIQFIGRGGVMLHESLESPATYRFRGNEGYVRARVLESNGDRAWTQPVMLDGATR